MLKSISKLLYQKTTVRRLPRPAVVFMGNAKCLQTFANFYPSSCKTESFFSGVQPTCFKRSSFYFDGQSSPFLGCATILIVISGCVETSQHLPCSLQVTTEICKTQEVRRISPNTFFPLDQCLPYDQFLDLCDWSLIHLSHIKHGCQVNVMLTSVQAWCK